MTPIAHHRTAAAGSGLLVTERFGPTVQGEGPSAGHPAVFVRLSRCNLACGDGAASFACDTPYTWDWTRFDPREQSERESVDEVTDWILGHSPRLVVVTGGEPLLQHGGVSELADRLVEAGRRVEIETNGTIVPPPELLRPGVRFNVSPKLSNSGMAARRRIVPEALSAYASCRRAAFKFVACGVRDLDEVAALEERFGLAPIWIMPEGTDPVVVLERLRVLADSVIARGWHLTSRLHIQLWGDVRGR